MCECASYVVLDPAVVHGWVQTEGQVINTEEKRHVRDWYLFSWLWWLLYIAMYNMNLGCMGLCVHLPRANLFGNVSQVVQLRQALRCGNITVGFDGCHQLPQACRWCLHQPLAGANHTPVLLWPVCVLVASWLVPVLVVIEDVAERILSLR